MKMFTQIWNNKALRNRILFTIGLLVAYRFLAHITVPGANLQSLAILSEQNSGNELFTVFSLLTGGSAETFSIVLMGIAPYINASIIIQLLTVVIPKLEALSKEGQAGRQKINSYTRWLTLPLALLQSYGMILLLNYQAGVPIIENTSDVAVMAPAMLTISAGTILLVWLGEQISEKGIGNGISLIIFASIIAQVPVLIAQSVFAANTDDSNVLPFVAIIVMTILLITAVVFVNEAQRRVPVTYGTGRGKAQQTYLPMRINQAGMIPIIFAFALITFPGIIGQFMLSAQSESVRNVGDLLANLITTNSITYMVIFYLLIVGFTYFYISITFNPEKVAENIQKRGGYIPGVRPGKETTDHIAKISSRLTFWGSNFLALVAVVPLLVQQISSGGSTVSSIPILISGGSIIIMVGVILELIRQVNSSLITEDYQKFYK
jgi:preprotein translocase subunit SecY